MPRHVVPVGERIKRRIEVDPETQCWLWQGAMQRNGYGRIAMGRGPDGKPEIRFVHRAAYEAFVGPIPEGLVLDHLCRVPNCVNPEHLEPVTQAVNNARGISPAAINGRKAQCDHGHPLEGENVYTTTAGHRACRACRAQLDIASRQRVYAASRRVAYTVPRELYAAVMEKATAQGVSISSIVRNALVAYLEEE